MAKSNKKEVKFQHKDARRRDSDNQDGHSRPALSPSRKSEVDGNWTDDEKPQQAPPQSEYEKKKQTFITRAIWSIVMIALFFGAMFAGHIYIIFIVTAIQIISFKEVIAISNVPSRARKLRFTKTLNWYFLGTTMYFLYGESVIYYFKHIILVDKVLLPLSTHHRFISFMLYVMGESVDAAPSIRPLTPI